MAVKANNKENQGFKLLQEDSLDDRPCAAVKKFVASVLDKKDLKDQDVAASFRNLIEYREAPPSPTGGSHSAMDGDEMGSPTTPASPTPGANSGHTERLPNELLDEICEDIGMKSGEHMELDFVEFLMEQDVDPQAYMTPEGILHSQGTLPPSSGGSSGSGGGGGNVSAASSNISTPSNSSGGGSGSGFGPTPGGMGGSVEWQSHMPSPIMPPVAGSTTALSSGSSSPATKRIHLSTSEQSSPAKESSSHQQQQQQHQQQQQGAGSCQQQVQSQPPYATSQVFKMPQTPPTPRRSMSCPQGSTGVQLGSTQNNSAGFSVGSSPAKMGSFSPKLTGNSGQYVKEEAETGSQSSSCSKSSTCSGSTASNHFLHKSPAESLSKAQCFSPNHSQFSSCDHARRMSEGSMQIASSLPQQPPPHSHQQQPPQTDMQHFSGMLPSQQAAGSKDASYQKLGKLPPPNVNVKNFPQMRWGVPGGSMGGHPQHPHPGLGMGKAGYGYPMQGTNRMDSPLDQGYFSNESAGNGTSSSAPSPGLTASSMSSLGSSLSSMSSLSTMMPADPSKSQAPPSLVCARQKSVHFADPPNQGSPDAMTQTPSSGAMDMQSYSRYSCNQSPSDCAFDMDASQPNSRKMVSRHHHGLKPGVAPYTVPTNSAMVAPPTSGSYDFANRSSCALNPQSRSSPADVGVAGAGSSGSMQPFDFAASSQGAKGVPSDNMYYMDNNQNMMRMDSSPGMDFAGQSSAYPNAASSSYNLPVNQMRAAQQQQGAMSSEMMHMQQQRMQQQQMQQQQIMQQQHAPPPQQQAQSAVSGDGSQSFSSCGMAMVPGQSNQHVPGNSAGPMTMQAGFPAQQGMGGMAMNSGVQQGMNMGVQHSPNPMNMQQPVMSEGLTGMPAPPHGFQPSSMSTPCMQRLPGEHRAPPSLQGPGFGSMPPGYDFSMGGRPPANMEGQMYPPQQQGTMPGMMSPAGASACTPAWTGPPTNPHGVQDSGMVPHPGQMKPPPPHPMHQQPGSAHHMQAMAMGQQALPQPQAPPQPHPGPCSANSSCPGCKLARASQPGPASKAFSSQQKFIQHLIMDESNSAYRSHPLYPLLRDLVIAGMNFDDPKFHYQQLLSLLPHDFEKLLQNFLHRNPPSGNYQSNYSVESVLMDSLRLAHSNLVEKIRARQEQEKCKALTSTSIRSMEEFCEKFDHTQMVGMGPPGGAVNGCSPMLMATGPPGQMADMSMQTPLHVMTSMGPPAKVMVTLGQGGFVSPMGFRAMKEDMMSAEGAMMSGPAAQKTESKKHPSLPKEAVSLMMEWLRGHKDNPYPNDDEKAMLIKQTGLTINQINYWFTNARRRILPKWAQCK